MVGNNFNINVSIEALIHEQMETIAKYFAEKHEIAITSVHFRWCPMIGSKVGTLLSIDVDTTKNIL